MPRPILNTERGFGGKPPKKLVFRRHLAGSKMPKEGSKMPKETFFHGDLPLGEWSRGARSMPRVFGRGSRRQPAALVSDRDDAALFPAPVSGAAGDGVLRKAVQAERQPYSGACSSTWKRSPLAATNLLCISGIQHIDLMRQYRGAASTC